MAEAAVLGGLTLLLLIGGGAAAAYFTSASDKPVAIKGSFSSSGGADYGSSGAAVNPQQRAPGAPTVTTRP
jgi:hypothetical protein